AAKTKGMTPNLMPRLIARNRPRLNVVNLVATADLKQLIDLQRLDHCRGFIYSSTTYRGLCAYLKDEQTHGKVTIFASGKMISVGSRSYSSAKEDLKHAAERLRRL